MKRYALMVAAVCMATTHPAFAQEGRNAVDRSKQPTGTTTDAVPSMKRDAAPTIPSPLPADKAMGEAVPSMKPTDSGSGTASSGPVSPKAAAITANTAGSQFGGAFFLSEAEGKAWISKPVYSSDGQKIGSVVAFQRKRCAVPTLTGQAGILV
jgi:hypothetical protein